ncbi:MAG: Fis family transcriptional regulator [Rhizobiales bacterium 32-66-11]|nr:MAG: Fis family transcriptional regulator [Rhizobiales bacterium 32-66-11]
MSERCDAYHADRVFSTLRDDGATARSAIAASWSRSLVNYGLDPTNGRPPRRLSEGEFARAFERLDLLAGLAEGELDRLFHMAGEAGCCVMLTDADAVPLVRRGASGDDVDFRRLGLWTGMVWSEASEGTNGIGTCLAEARALTVHREQHFLARNIGLSCTVAPIWDAHGRLAAALDVSTCRSDLTPALLKLIGAATVEAAQRIEQRHFRAAFSHARILVADDDRGPRGLLAVDREDLVIGASRCARLAFGLSEQRLATPFPADDLLGRQERADDFSTGERGVVQRAMARAHGNVSAAARMLGISRATLHRKLTRLRLDRPH